MKDKENETFVIYRYVVFVSPIFMLNNVLCDYVIY